jgi:hypothetical protein
LEKIDTVTDIETDRSKQVASFRVSKTVDYKSKLEELAKTTPKLADYSIQ